MKILVSNDDGVYADGIWALARQLSRFAQITVVAPDREQSAVGTAVTLRKPLRVQKIVPLVPGIEAYGVEGTPSDAVIVALGKVLTDKVDLVVSGVNQGSNLGEDVLISGTVGAALAGYLRSFPAIAISCGKWYEPYLTSASTFVALLVERLMSARLPSNFLLNINVPEKEPGAIKGIKITRLAQKSHINTVEEGHDGRRAYYTLMRQAVTSQTDRRTDIWAMEHDYISITPLHLFLENHFPTSVLDRIIPGLLEKFQKDADKAAGERPGSQA